MKSKTLSLWRDEGAADLAVLPQYDEHNIRAVATSIATTRKGCRRATLVLAFVLPGVQKCIPVMGRTDAPAYLQSSDLIFLKKAEVPVEGVLDKANIMVIRVDQPR